MTTLPAIYRMSRVRDDDTFAITEQPTARTVTRTERQSEKPDSEDVLGTHPAHGQLRGNGPVSRGMVDHLTVAKGNPRPEAESPDISASRFPVQSSNEDSAFPFLRTVSGQLFALSTITFAAFLWMCTGNDDVSNPFLILVTWMTYMFKTSIIFTVSAMVWVVWSKASWPLRISALSLLLLNGVFYYYFRMDS